MESACSIFKLYPKREYENYFKMLFEKKEVQLGEYQWFISQINTTLTYPCITSNTQFKTLMQRCEEDEDYETVSSVVFMICSEMYIDINATAKVLKILKEKRDDSTTIESLKRLAKLCPSTSSHSRDKKHFLYMIHQIREKLGKMRDKHPSVCVIGENPEIQLVLEAMHPDLTIDTDPHRGKSSYDLIILNFSIGVISDSYNKKDYLGYIRMLKSLLKPRGEIMAWDYNITTVKECLVNDISSKINQIVYKPIRHIVWAELDMLMLESGFKLIDYGYSQHDLVKSGCIPENLFYGVYSKRRV